MKQNGYLHHLVVVDTCFKTEYEKQTSFTACCCHHSNDLVFHIKKDFIDPAALSALLVGVGPCGQKLV